MSSWQEHFFEKLVAAARAAGEERLATALLHRRKKTASFQHPQLRRVECLFGSNRTSGNPYSQVLLIECEPKRGTEIDRAALKRELQEAGIGGEVQADAESVFFQCRWGFGPDAVFPVHDPRQVEELTRWVLRTVRLLFDHMERRRHVVAPSNPQTASSKPLDLRVTLEQYLEDLLAEQWETLPWAAELEYLDRQVECGSLGRIDILARDRRTGDYVVIELKRDQGDDEVVGQVSRYMGWIKQHWADHQGVGVLGIIVAHEATDRLRSAVLPHPNISLYTYQFSLALAPVVATAREVKSKASC